jgi:uncharacterized protein (DUF608 family)
MKRKPIRSFAGASLSQIAFPLGGIGTGTVSLGGRGNLQDWELFNRPNKGSHLPTTFFAVRAQPKNRPPVTRILERQFFPPFIGWEGFPRHAWPGVRRFQDVTFRGEYPFAWLEFEDDAMPVRVSLEAFNPFIPMNVEDSSIPCAILRYTVKNPKRVPVSVSLLAVVSNPIGFQTLDSPRQIDELLNAYREEELVVGVVPDRDQALGRPQGRGRLQSGGGLRGIYFSAPNLPADDINFGTAALTTDHANTDVQTHLFRGGWFDAEHILWDEFTATGMLTHLLEPRHGRPLDPKREKKRKSESGALCLRAKLAAGEARTFTIFLHWHFPNARLWAKDGKQVRTFVGKQFADAWDAARYTHRNFKRLDAETRKWHETFFASTLPPEALDAVSSNISTIRSPTVLRLDDGKIYAWEGCRDDWGSCAGNCTHVWNYAQTLAFLFPSLERTMREINFGPNMKPNGAMAFRCGAPSTETPVYWDHPPCADGQMGNVIQAYRDWQLSGDDAWLRALWPNIKRALEYAWGGDGGSASVPLANDQQRKPEARATHDLWDPNKDGVMEGCQHNTYDIEFYGPNTLTGALYLGALRAAEEMARHLGEGDKAREYREIYEQGRARTEKELWNGEHFMQRVEVMEGLKIPPHLQSPAFTAEAQRSQSSEKESASSASSASLRLNTAPESDTRPRYQYGEGCLSDQVFGQLCAHVAGLGHVLDSSKVQAALRSIFKSNFLDPIGELDNVQRVYALQDEAGLVVCSWPKGNRPTIPMPYCQEVFTGIEYQVAAHMIYEGMVKEALTLVRAARARYDGVRRNPWDELECGHHYARALSSWALIQALSGVHYSAVEQSLTFDPKLKPPFTCVFAAGTAWGLLRVENNRATLEVRHGRLALRKFGPIGRSQSFSSSRDLCVGRPFNVQW